MNISTLAEAKASKIKTTDDDLIVSFVDGREIKIPLIWFPRLFHADSAKRNNYRIIGNGVGIHWPDLDEDLSVEAFLR